MDKKKLRTNTGLHKIITLHHHIIPVSNTGRKKRF